MKYNYDIIICKYFDYIFLAHCSVILIIVYIIVQTNIYFLLNVLAFSSFEEL